LNLLVEDIVLEELEELEKVGNAVLEELEKELEKLEKVGNAVLEELEKEPEELELENSGVEIKLAIISFKVGQVSLDTRTRLMTRFNHSGTETNIKINIFIINKFKKNLFTKICIRLSF